jgi:hypothetical protein
MASSSTFTDDLMAAITKCKVELLLELEKVILAHGLQFHLALHDRHLELKEAIAKCEVHLLHLHEELREHEKRAVATTAAAATAAAATAEVSKAWLQSGGFVPLAPPAATAATAAATPAPPAATAA